MEIGIGHMRIIDTNQTKSIRGVLSQFGLVSETIFQSNQNFQFENVRAGPNQNDS